MATDPYIDDVIEGPDPDDEFDPAARAGADMVEADRMIRKALRLRRELSELLDVFDAHIGALYAARDTAVSDATEKIGRLELALRLWHQARLAEDPKRKTIRLPHGTLTATAAQESWEYDDPVFLEWAREHAQGAIRPPKPRPDEIAKSDARKVLAPILQTQVVDGVTMTVVDGDGHPIDVNGEKIPGLIVQPGGTDNTGRHYKIKEA